MNPYDVMTDLKTYDCSLKKTRDLLFSNVIKVPHFVLSHFSSPEAELASKDELLDKEDSSFGLKSSRREYICFGSFPVSISFRRK